MQAEVISIGTELLLGDITDTNATTIAKSLRTIGLDLIYRTTVGDNEKRIANAIDIALNRVDIVITTGGLGPTADDVTREAIATAAGRPLEFHQSLLDQISERFDRFGVKMTANNRRQAFAPQGAIVIENPVGTAPVFILETDRGIILTLPGVPKEMVYLLDHSLTPWLKTRIGNDSVIRSRTLRTAGIGESQIDTRIADLMTSANPTVGLAAHSGQTDIRITAKAANEAEADHMIAPVEQEIRSRVGEWVYGLDDDSLEAIVASLVRSKRLSLSVAEYGTDCLLQSRLRNATASMPEIRLENVALDKLPESGVEPKDVAEKEAQQIRSSNHTDLGLVVIVHHAMEDATRLTEIGIALASDDGAVSRAFSWGAERTDQHIWVTTYALAQLWRYLTKSASSHPA